MFEEILTSLFCSHEWQTGQIVTPSSGMFLGEVARTTQRAKQCTKCNKTKYLEKKINWEM